MRDDERRLPGEGIPQTLFSLVWDVERRIRRHFRGTNLHWGLRRILQRLWLEDGLSQKELSDAVGSSEASISNMLKHLLKGGWIERRQDDYDYRISRVVLTAKGAALRDGIVEDLRELDEAVRADLGRSEAQQLEALLGKAADALREATADEDIEQGRILGIRPSPPGEL